MATRVKFEVTRETAFNVLRNAVATTNADPYLIEGELIDELFDSLERVNFVRRIRSRLAILQFLRNLHPQPLPFRLRN